MSLMEEAQSIRERIRERLRELAPLAAEYEELLVIAREMGLESEDVVAVTASAAETTPAPAAVVHDATPPAARAPARRSARASGGTSRSRRGGANDIGARVLAAVSQDPGGTVADYAERLGVTAAVLYRPVRELASDGRLVKRGRQLLVP